MNEDIRVSFQNILVYYDVSTGCRPRQEERGTIAILARSTIQYLLGSPLSL
jgi:hypothetical protein